MTLVHLATKEDMKTEEEILEDLRIGGDIKEVHPEEEEEALR